MKERHENGKCVSVERTHRQEGNITTLAREGGRGRTGMEHLFEMSLDRLMTVLPDVVT